MMMMIYLLFCVGRCMMNLSIDFYFYSFDLLCHMSTYNMIYSFKKITSFIPLKLRNFTFKYKRKHKGIFTVN